MFSSQFFTLFRRLVLRNAMRHRLLTVLNVLCVALGVAVFLAIQIANYSATRSFNAAFDLVAGKSHLEIRGTINELLYPKIVDHPGVAAATPLVENVVTLPDIPGEFLRLFGIDVFTNAPFRTFELTQPNIENWLATRNGIAITPEFASMHQLQVGDTIRAVVNTRIVELKVLFLLETKETGANIDTRFAVMDIGWAQELFGTSGSLNSIQVLTDPPRAAEAVAEDLRRILPSNLQIAAPSQRSFQVEKMLAGFKLNLTALSMVALLVGMFLIYNTIAASATRRRQEIGILRSLGASRSEVRALFLAEALTFGTIGVCLGLVGGVALSSTLIGSVARTITSRYVLTSIDRTYLNPLDFVITSVLGLGAVALASWQPASRAARTDPVEALLLRPTIASEKRTTPSWSTAGAVLLLVAFFASTAALKTPFAWLGFAAAFFVLIGFACFSPDSTRLFSTAVEAFTRRLLLVRLAASNLGRGIHRNAITIASLSAAVAMMVSVSVMIYSFRHSVERWIDRSIIADLFIAPASNLVTGLGAFMPAETIDFLQNAPHVSVLDTFRKIQMTFREEIISLAVVEGIDRRNLHFVGGSDREKMQRFLTDRSVVLITESFARRFGLKTGQSVTLDTPAGLQDFEISGIYYDYTSDQGLILMARRTFEQFWNDDRVQSLAVYLEPDARSEDLERSFRKEFSDRGEFVVYRNSELHERILAIFDETFAVTYVLRVIAILVAVIGIFLSVTTLVIERQREIGVLRALGCSRGQIQQVFLYEAALLSVVASILGILAGIALSMLLIWVINRAFFGWSIALEMPWTLLAAAPLWIGVASIVSAWIPAIQAGRTEIASAIRSE